MNHVRFVWCCWCRRWFGMSASARGAMGAESLHWLQRQDSSYRCLKERSLDSGMVAYRVRVVDVRCSFRNKNSWSIMDISWSIKGYYLPVHRRSILPNDWLVNVEIIVGAWTGAIRKGNHDEASWFMGLQHENSTRPKIKVFWMWSHTRSLPLIVWTATLTSKGVLFSPLSSSTL